MTNRYRVEAWSLPLATSTKTVHAVPFITGSYSDPVTDVGRGAITVRGDWDRLTDVDDPDSGVSSYYRVFQDNTIVGGFFGHRSATEIADTGNKLVTIDGGGQGKVMEFARVENFDYPVKPTAEGDWNFGSGLAAGLVNGDMEETEGGNDFEDEKLGGWAKATSPSWITSNDTDPDVDNADAQAGSFSLVWDPDQFHSGVAKSFTLEGGGTYDFSVYLKSVTTGKRFVFGIAYPKGSSNATTNGYIWNGYLFCELGNVARSAAKDGNPGGSTDGLWQQMQLNITLPEFDSDPEQNTKRIQVVVLYDHHAGGDGPQARIDTFTATGPGLGIQPWHRTAASSVVTVFEQSTDQVHGDTYSAKITTVSADHGIAQVIDKLTAGRTYTFSAWVYHADGTNQNFTLYLKHETGGSTSIATNTVSVVTATWTLISVTGVTDDEDITVVVRKQNASTFYIDDATFAEGQAAQSWGEINQQLLDDAAVDHTAEAGDLARDTLGFLDYNNFTETLDSAGNTWTPATVEYRAVRGKRYDQIEDDGLGMGFEWRVTDTGSAWELDVYNKYDWTARTGGIGTDRRGTAVPAIKFGAGIKAGPLVISATGSNRIHTEGEDFQWDVRRDATAIGNYDTREGYEGDVNLLGDATLGVVADQILDRTIIPTKGIKVVIDPQDDNAEVPTPYVDFFPGDTYPINLIGLFQGDKRVVGITTDFTQGTAVYTVEFDQSSYTSDPLKSVVRAVQMLLDRFDELRLPPRREPDTPFDHEHDKESIPTVLVAASDARPEVQNMADYVCNGTDDWIEINAAIAALPAPGGRVVLSEGTFNVDTDKIDTTAFSTWLMGMGYDATVLHTTNTTGTVVTLGNQGVLSDLAITGTTTVGTHHGVNAGAETTVRNCWFALMDGGIEVGHSQVWITENYFSTLGGDAIKEDGLGGYTDCRITNNIILTGGINVDDMTDTLIADNQLAYDVYGSPNEHIAVVNNNFLSASANNTHRIELDDALHSPLRIIISGNTMTDAGYGGVSLHGVDDATVQGNFLEGTGELTGGIVIEDCTNISIVGNQLVGNLSGHGIAIIDTLDSLISDNLIFEPGINTANTYDGIILSGNSDRNYIHGNKIKPKTTANQPRYGINVSASTCDDNKIGDNDYGVVADYDTDILNDAGTGTIYTTAANIDLFDSRAELTTITGSMGKKLKQDCRIVGIVAEVGTAPTGNSIILDIQTDGGGNNLYTTQANRPTILVATTTSSITLPDVVNLLGTSYLTMDIDQIGSSVAGGYLVLTLLVIYI